METPILLKTPEVVIRWYTFRGSSSLLVNKAHQESIQNTFTRTRSDFLMCVHNSAILDSPKVRVSLSSTLPRFRYMSFAYRLALRQNASLYATRFATTRRSFKNTLAVSCQR